jgi:hypothetical protein
MLFVMSTVTDMTTMLSFDRVCDIFNVDKPYYEYSAVAIYANFK